MEKFSSFAKIFGFIVGAINIVLGIVSICLAAFLTGIASILDGVYIIAIICWIISVENSAARAEGAANFNAKRLEEKINKMQAKIDEQAKELKALKERITADSDGDMHQ